MSAELEKIFGPEVLAAFDERARRIAEEVARSRDVGAVKVKTACELFDMNESRVRQLIREGRLKGLRHEHLSLVDEGGVGRGIVRVRQVAVKVRGGGWEFHAPKTRKGVRDVPFPAWLYRELERYGALIDSRRLACGPEWTDFGLVFPSRTGAPRAYAVLAAGRLKPLLKRAGLHSHFTLYSLRYTFATLQYLAGERDRVISDMMGHTRTDFTKEVYTKVLPLMRERASDSLERLLFGGVRTALAQSSDERVM